jgi:hypothetical protein
VDRDQLADFARRYTAAWCSGKPQRVAEHYAEEGSLTINDGAPVGGASCDCRGGERVHDRLSRSAGADGRLGH